jgi:hypothetical protein
LKKIMTLTRDFRLTVKARARRDSRFREALSMEAVNAGDPRIAKALRRVLLSATAGSKNPRRK